MSKERPILFSAPMVRAILDGSKTQTRRIVKPQPIEHDGIIECGPAIAGSMHALHQWIIANKCPYGKPCDRLWVRETWGYYDYDGPGGDPGTDVVFRATDDISREELRGSKWRPSIHIPREFSRITLEVVSVRVERLNEISEHDAWAEGIKVRFCEAGKPCTCESNPVGEFQDLWESINGPGSWEVNPWVWVVEFKKIEP